MKNTVLLFLLSSLSFNAMADLVLYTDRPTVRMQVIAEKFKQKTNVTIQVIELPYKDLNAKLQTEGAQSPADVIFVKDLVFLEELSRQNKFAPMVSEKIQSQVLPAMRHPQNLWAAVTFRARTLVYDAALDVSTIQTYADLAQPEWAQSLCLRTGKAAYNEALVASLIATEGFESAKNIVSGWLNNRPQPMVYSDDTQILKAIGSGDCAMGIANSYYLGLLLANPATAQLPVKIKFLNQNKNGVHVNGMGAGISKTTQQAPLATQFVEFLLTDEIQLYLSGEQMDYPAKVGLLPQTLVKDFGTFKADTTSWKVLGDQIESARLLIKDVDYQ